MCPNKLLPTLYMYVVIMVVICSQYPHTDQLDKYSEIAKPDSSTNLALLESSDWITSLRYVSSIWLINDN